MPVFDARLATSRTTRGAPSGTAGAVSIPAMVGDHELVITSDRGYAHRTITIGATTLEVESR
ncbi:MAG: hypothetical protein WKG01_38230 [Kofleriaceae bacterium]